MKFKKDEFLKAPFFLALNSRKINEITSKGIESIQSKINDARNLGKETMKIVIEGKERETSLVELETVLNKIKDKMGERFEKALDKAILDKNSAPEYLRVFAERVDKKVRIEKGEKLDDSETEDKVRHKF